MKSPEKFGPEEIEKLEKEKREIEIIEKSPLKYQDKMELALLYLGERPSIWIDTPTSYKIFYETENDREIGLTLGYPETAVEAFVSGDELDYRELPKEEIRKLTKEGTSKFLDFHLSKDHWQEELNLVKRQQALIKEKFPNLYKEIIEYGVDQIGRKETKKEDSEKQSSIKKIIGSIDEEGREELREEFARRFSEQEIAEFKEKEIEKTSDQIEIIKFVNDETNKLLEKYGLPRFDIPSDNVHLLKEKDYKKFFEIKKEKEARGNFLPYYQSIFIKRDKSILIFGKVCFHEFVHFKSSQTLQMIEGKEANLYQIGIAVGKKLKGKYFENLNEAITEELCKRIFYKNALGNPKLPRSFRQEIEETEEIKKESLSEIENEKERKKIQDIILWQTTPFYLPDGRIKYKSEFDSFDLPKEREILNNLIEKLYFKNKDKFKNEEEVFDLFAKSVFTGKLSWGRLVNKTFGKGTFKKLTELDENVEKLEEFVNDL